MVVLTRRQKLRDSTAVSTPGVGVPDPRHEEFQETHAGLVTDRSDQRRQRPGASSVILRGGVSRVTTRERLEVVIYARPASDRRAEQLGGCVA